MAKQPLKPDWTIRDIEKLYDKHYNDFTKQQLMHLLLAELITTNTLKHVKHKMKKYSEVTKRYKSNKKN